jgi:phosphatidylserine/phosphatidylglycerophosphate/cardiolipin synthase-like enzyme
MELEKALGAAVQRGVTVRALIAHMNKGGEKRLRKLEQRLLEAGVTVARTADDLPRYHGKMTIIDDTVTFSVQLHETRHREEPQLSASSRPKPSS